jgi:hypothetical protein
MLQAIQSIVSNTIDVYLKLISPDVRRRKVGKIAFKLYRDLGGVAQAMDNVGQIFRHAVDLDNRFPIHGLSFLYDEGALNGAQMVHFSPTPEANVGLRVPSIEEDGTATSWIIDGIPERKLLLGVALSAQIRNLERSFWRLSGVLEDESRRFVGMGKGGVVVQKISIYDPELARLLSSAWESDGGFVEAIRHLHIKFDFNERVVRLFDSRFVPGMIRPRLARGIPGQVYKIDNPEQLARLLDLIDSSAATVREAKEAVREFMVKHFTIADIV